MTLQDIFTTAPVVRTRDLVTVTTDSWTRNLSVLTKQLGPAAFFSGATRAVDQWADVMGWMLKTQRQYVSAATATANVVSGRARRGPAGVPATPRLSSRPLPELESTERVEIHRVEELRAVHETSAHDGAVTKASLEQAERERAAEATAAERATDRELDRVELEEAARAAEVEREHVRVARNLARQQSRKAAKTAADRRAKVEAAEAAAREAAEEAARDEAASRLAAQAERAADQAQARQAARAVYAGRPKAELVGELVGRGLPKSGNVVDLIERLVEADLA